MYWKNFLFLPLSIVTINNVLITLWTKLFVNLCASFCSKPHKRGNSGLYIICDLYRTKYFPFSLQSGMVSVTSSSAVNCVQKYWMKNSRNELFVRLKLCTLLSSMINLTPLQSILPGMWNTPLSSEWVHTVHTEQ